MVLFTVGVYQEIKDTIDKEAVYRCMTNCYEACQVFTSLYYEIHRGCYSLESRP